VPTTRIKAKRLLNSLRGSKYSYVNMPVFGSNQRSGLIKGKTRVPLGCMGGWAGKDLLIDPKPHVGCLSVCP
jgi:hypothetical protein